MKTISQICAPIIMLALAQGAAAEILVPDSHAGVFIDWSRGHFGSTYAEWDEFSSALGAAGNAPDVGTVGPDGAVLRQVTIPSAPGGILLTGTKNIYSWSNATEFEVTIPGLDRGAGSNTRVVAQIGVVGTPLESLSVLLTPAGGTAAAPSYASPSGDLFAWDLADNAGEYLLSFAASGTSMSLDTVVIDTYTQSGQFSAFPAAVPSPTGSALALLACLAPLGRARGARPVRFAG